MTRLPSSFFQSSDVVKLAQKLLGQEIITKINGQRTAGLITETEAYDGSVERGSHAYLHKRTPRTEVMFAPGGRTYVYVCYGIHHMLNIVTGLKDRPQAILIRAIIPTVGQEIMLRRRHQQKLTPKLTVGPGNVAQALGLTLVDNNQSLGGQIIWVNQQPIVPLDEIKITPRIGIDYAGADKNLLWRFIWTPKK
jgi:DNA-3-methyladenine glycosylase